MVQVWNRFFGGTFLGVRADCWLLLALSVGATGAIVVSARLNHPKDAQPVEFAEPVETPADAAPEPVASSPENPAMQVSKAEEEMLKETVQGMKRKICCRFTSTRMPVSQASTPMVGWAITATSRWMRMTR